MYLLNLKKYPYTLFWIGLIIGAIITGVLFWFRLYGFQLDTAIFKSPTYKTQQQTKPKIQQQKQQKKGSLFQLKKSAPSTVKLKKGTVDESDPSPTP